MANNMDKLIERIANEENFTWAKAKEKLNLIYVKMTVADIKSFQDEFTTWLMDVKKLNFKAILKTPDTELHDIFVNEFKK